MTSRTSTNFRVWFVAPRAGNNRRWYSGILGGWYSHMRCVHVRIWSGYNCVVNIVVIFIGRYASTCEILLMFGVWIQRYWVGFQAAYTIDAGSFLYPLWQIVTTFKSIDWTTDGPSQPCPSRQKYTCSPMIGIGGSRTFVRSVSFIRWRATCDSWSWMDGIYLSIALFVPMMDGDRR